MADNDRRVLADRSADASDQLDRIPLRTGSPRAFAAQVYDGGQMPTTTPAWFLTHPVDYDCPESEGGPCEPTADTSLSIPVIVLGKVPSAGDVLVAEMVGSKWVAELGGGTKSHICVAACGFKPVLGALVEVFDHDGKMVAGCTTGLDGCCDVDVAGTYRVRVTVSGIVAFDGQRGVSPTTLIVLPNKGLVCCGDYVIPYHLTLTDAAGSIDLWYYPHYFFPIWFGGHAVQRTSCPVTTPNNVCVVGAPSQGPVRVCYQMVCFAGQPGEGPPFSVQRSWSWVYQQGTLDPIWYQDPSGFTSVIPDPTFGTSGVPCATSPPAICGSPLTDSAGFAASPSSSSPFLLSGTPAFDPDFPSNSTADPIGGGVVISA